MQEYFQEKGMVEKSVFKDFLKGVLGLAEAKGDATKTHPSVEPIAAPPQPIPIVPKPRTEAYINRRKGRPVHKDKLGYLDVICPYLVRKGESIPGEMVRDLGLPKSTMIYNLNRLLRLCDGFRKTMYRDISPESAIVLLGGKRLVRVGGGKYVRYRLVDVPPKP
jgi:hypothetical protein